MIVKKYLVIFIYFFICFFCLGIIVRVGAVLLYGGEFYLPISGLIKNLKMSVITSFSITLASLIFNKIDKYNARKKPPIDPDK